MHKTVRIHVSLDISQRFVHSKHFFPANASSVWVCTHCTGAICFAKHQRACKTCTFRWQNTQAYITQHRHQRPTNKNGDTFAWTENEYTFISTWSPKEMRFVFKGSFNGNNVVVFLKRSHPATVHIHCPYSIQRHKIIALSLPPIILFSLNLSLYFFKLLSQTISIIVVGL